MEILNLTGSVINKSNLIDNVIEVADVAYNDNEEQDINEKVEKFLLKTPTSTEHMHMAARVIQDLAHTLEVENVLIDVDTRFQDILHSSLHPRGITVFSPEELTTAA